MEYKILRSQRRTISLEVKSGELVVRSPFFVSRRTIERFVNSKEEWIKKHLEKSRKVNLKNRRFAEGEKFLYFGREKTLHMVFSKLEKVKVEDRIILFAGRYSEAKRILKDFYCQETKRAVERYIKEFKNDFALKTQKLIFKTYRSKWGSCSVKNTLSFSATLAMAPKEVIEYVVIHELAHLKIKNHSKKFWVEVGQHDPNYKIHRKWLRDNHHKLSL